TTITLTIPPASAAANAPSAPQISAVELLPSGQVRLTLDKLAPPTGDAEHALPCAFNISLVAAIDNPTEKSGLFATTVVKTLVPVPINEKTQKPETTMKVDFAVPKGIALGFHSITVQRLVNTQLDTTLPAQWEGNGDSAATLLDPQVDFEAVALADTLQIYRNEARIKELGYLDADGKPTSLRRIAKTDLIAFSIDHRLMFIAGNEGNIHVMDTTSLMMVKTLSVGTNNLRSLAVAGDWLYVAEGGNTGSATPNVPTPNPNRLLRVNIDPFSPEFMQYQTITLPSDVSGDNAPFGYSDLAITQADHLYLAVTASTRHLNLLSSDPRNTQGGNVFIVDIDAATDKGRLDASRENAWVKVNFPLDQGKGPQTIASAGVTTTPLADGKTKSTLRFLLSDVQDLNAGLATVTVDVDDQGAFASQPPVFAQIKMFGALKPKDRYQGKYLQSIQRAESPILVNHKGVDYALVADHYLDIADPGYYVDALGGKAAGGKIGIVKDPFGLKPEYLGSTTPVIAASYTHLQVSADGKKLWADIRYWPVILEKDDKPPVSGLLVWDVDTLLAAAEKNSIVKQNTWRPLPIDLERVGTSEKRVVTPTKYDLDVSGKFASGWVYGMGRSRGLNIEPEQTAVDNSGARNLMMETDDEKPQTPFPFVHYGDVLKIDIRKFITYGEPMFENATVITGVNEKTIRVEGYSTAGNSGQFAEEKIITNANGTIMSTNPDNKGPAICAASAKEYQSAKFEDTWVFFLAPSLDNFEMRALRNGERLPDKKITIYLGDITIRVADGDYELVYIVKDLSLTFTVSDFGSAEGRVFFGDRDLNNPGYSKFDLSDAVKIRPAATKLTAAQTLDVWRVEQRLKYLGFSSFEKTHNNQIKEFEVDGNWGDVETTALRGFYSATHYTSAAYTPGGSGYEATNSQPAKTVTPTNNDQDNGNLNWLNAFNAPHMIDIYSALPVPRPPDTATIINRFRNGAGTIEAYSSSWVYDWLLAWRQSQDNFSVFPAQDQANVLVTSDIKINGLTSPPGYNANHEHESGGHSTLMSMDMGFRYNFITDDNARRTDR
ncbi:MAG TPA: hypothetical protein VJ001_04735, partial [Rhodocyclaceae bacterium]|nr:hypothetical protein [Rhodocyclaceae bacterium]